MSWMLTASGRAPGDSGGHAWLECERKLVAELQAVLSKPEYGAVSSWFRGIHVASSDVHRAPEVTPQDKAAVVTEPAPVPAAAEPVKAAPSRGGKATAARTAA